MESVGSSSTSPPCHHRFNPMQPFSDRVIRAISHRLRLLHRSDSLFFILGATANVYTVNISTNPSCTCPDRTTPCKHILFVLIRVLGIPLDDSLLWRRTLRPCQLHRLLNLPISGEALANAELRERFHQQQRASGCSRQPEAAAECGSGGSCPVCLEEMGREERVVACGTCKNVLHEECFLTWKRSCRRKSATCVLCRARWRNSSGSNQEKYLNLSAYVIEDDTVEMMGQCS